MDKKETLRRILEDLVLPETGLNLGRLNLVREIEILDNQIKLTVASTGLSPARQEWLKNQINEILKKFHDSERVDIEFKEFKAAELNQVKHIIAVISGKGGVGKSVVSSLLAVALNRRGYRVGILDADLTGPSIPRMFGLATRPEGTESAILPVLSRTGIEVMSLNLMLPGEEEAVIWRGPVISGVIRQFWEGVLWGNQDYLIVDLPPGTADAPLTVMQSIPITGIVIVFTPQALTAMIVKKTVKMAKTMGKRILGVVENMSYLYIPEIHKRMEIFGPSKADQIIEAAQAPLLARLPIDPVLTKLGDEGLIERYNAEVVTQMGDALIRQISGAERQQPMD